MSWNPFKAVDRAVDRALDKGSNVLHNARNEFKDTTRAVRRTASSAVNTARREFNETTQAARRTTNRAVNTVRREVGETSQAVRRTSNNFANTARREFNQTTQAAKRTTNRAVNIARREVGETSQAVRRTSNNFANTARREFNQTTQAAKRTTNRAVNIARREVGETSQAVRRTSNNFANTVRREVGETSQAVSRTTRNVANTARQVNLSNVGHTVLDGAGFIPVVGAAADVANGAWYAAEGDWKMAAFSLGAAVPIVGDAAAGAKAVTKVAKVVKDAKVPTTYLTYTLKDGDQVVRYVGRASGKGTPQQVLAGRISKGHHILQNNSNLKPHFEAVQGNRAANRGAEDVLYSRYQVPKPEKVNGKTLAPGANNRGQQLLNETNPLSNIAWKAKTIGRRKIEAYANDLKQP